MPELHQPWCADRNTIRSQDHWSAADQRTCASGVIEVGQSWIYLSETEDGKVQVILNGATHTLEEAAGITAGIEGLASAVGDLTSQVV